MACRSCGQTLPIVRKGLPTIYAFGPFPGWEDAEYTDLENDGPIHEEELPETTDANSLGIDGIRKHV